MFFFSLCQNGKWNCTNEDCPAVCSAWGDSHFKTFDGKMYDFQGSCDFLLASGTISDYETFSIIIQVRVFAKIAVRSIFIFKLLIFFFYFRLFLVDRLESAAQNQ